MKTILSLADHALIGIAFFIIAVNAFAQAPDQGALPDGTPGAAVYYCVPMHAWDTGYNVAINYDSLKNQFRAQVYAVDFFGEKPIFNETVQFDVAKDNEAGSCVFSFNQTQKSPGHSVAFRDFAHHEFAMELNVKGQEADSANKHMRCRVAPWFVDQFKSCN